MRNVNARPFIYGIVTLSGFLWFAIAYFSGLDLSKAADFFKILPNVVSIDLFVAAIFLKWGWKLPIFQDWLVPFPNISGTWKGHIVSDWVNPETGQRIAPMSAMLTVKQSFFHLHCVLRTDEMTSHSYAEGFIIDPDRQLKILAYTYTSKPRIIVSDRSRPHDGTALLEIIQKPEPKLTGRYWTERKTTGEMNFKFHSRDLLEEIPKETERHPILNQ